MTDLHFVTADVFTREPFGGNPLGVFPECRPLSDAVMQSLARELNLSETIFVFPPREARHTRRVRIYTPAREVPFAGHPTVGCAIVLAELGLLGPPAPRKDIVLEEEAGPVPVRIERRAHGLFATLTAPVVPQSLGPGPPNAEIAEMLGLSLEELAPEAAPGIYSAGLGFLMVPLKDKAALGRVRLDLSAWERLLSAGPAQEVYVLTMEDWRSGREVSARMFAPAAGIAEDPATGSAAAACARLLVEVQRPADGSAAWTIRQGVEMGRPSTIELRAELDGGKLARVEVGGEAVIMSEGRFRGL